MSTEFFVINLKGSDERLAQANGNLQQLDIVPTRVDAFDGRKLDPKSFPDYDDGKCRRYMGRSMTGGEIGCYVSHQRAARQFLESDADFGVVFEDDFEWKDDGANTLLALLDLLSNKGICDWQVVNIGAHKNKISTHLQELGEYAIQRGHYFPMLATGLIWNRDGAEEFLRYSKTTYMPLDNLLRHHLTRSNQGLTIWPALVQAGGFGSDIDTNTSRTDKSGRAWYYGFSKQKRLWIDKLIATKHKLIS